jgi:hypothetical protein
MTNPSQPSQTNPARQICDALTYLAGNCDGAQRRDAQGFNGRDTRFGKSLAQQIQQGRTLSDKQLTAGLKICRRYAATQLAPAGYSLPTQEAFQAYLQQRSGRAARATHDQTQGYTLTDCGTHLEVAWPDAERRAYIAAMMQVVPAHAYDWSPSLKVWLISPEYKDALIAALDAA